MFAGESHATLERSLSTIKAGWICERYWQAAAGDANAAPEYRYRFHRAAPLKRCRASAGHPHPMSIRAHNIDQDG